MTKNRSHRDPSVDVFFEANPRFQTLCFSPPARAGAKTKGGASTALDNKAETDNYSGLSLIILEGLTFSDLLDQLGIGLDPTKRPGPITYM